MMATIAEFERRQTAERISNSFQARAKRGLYNGGSVPLGYRIDEDKPGSLQFVPEEAEVVKLIFKTFLREGTLAATAKWLNGEKVRYPRHVRGGGQVRAKILKIDMLYRVLRNKAYIATRLTSRRECIDPRVVAMKRPPFGSRSLISRRSSESMKSSPIIVHAAQLTSTSSRTC